MEPDPGPPRCEASVARNLSYVCVAPCGGVGGLGSNVQRTYGFTGWGHFIVLGKLGLFVGLGHFCVPRDGPRLQDFGQSAS